VPFFIAINRSMTSNKHKIDYAEFYITNVCNYACTNCRSFNNLNLKGFQKWADCKDEYKKFAQRLDIEDIQILGGEPFLNPDIYYWIEGILSLWPNARVKVTTNGSRRQDDKLYNLLIKHNGRLQLDVSCHDENYFDKLHNNIKEFLGNCDTKIISNKTSWNTDYEKFKGEDWPDQPPDINIVEKLPWLMSELDDLGIDLYRYKHKNKRIEYTVNNALYAILGQAWNFSKSAIKVSHDKFYVDTKSDIGTAHKACISKYCHHFIDGKLYKCHLPYTLKEAITQEHVAINEEDYKILERYKPLVADESEHKFDKFIKNIKNPIEQCKFCPESSEAEKISIVDKKKMDAKTSVLFT